MVVLIGHGIDQTPELTPADASTPAVGSSRKTTRGCARWHIPAPGAVSNRQTGCRQGIFAAFQSGHLDNFFLPAASALRERPYTLP